MVIGKPNIIINDQGKIDGEYVNKGLKHLSIHELIRIAE